MTTEISISYGLEFHKFLKFFGILSNKETTWAPFYVVNKSTHIFALVDTS